MQSFQAKLSRAGLAFQGGAFISSSSTVPVQLVCSSKSSWEQMFSVFIKFLLADSSWMLVVSIWFGKLLFPLHVSHQANSMHTSRHGKLWDHSSGSNPNSNSLRGITGPSQAQSEYERDCYWVPGGQHYASGCLVYCRPVWNPAWVLMLRSHKSSNNFHSVFCFILFF